MLRKEDPCSYCKGTGTSNFAEELTRENKSRIYEYKWNRTNNPIYLHRAIFQAQQERVKLPEWVNKVLLDALNELIDSNGSSTFEKAISFKKSVFSGTSTLHTNELIAGLLVTAEGAGLTPGEAAELANYELKYVFQIEMRERDTLEKIKKKYKSIDTKAFFKVFMSTVTVATAGDAYHAAVYPKWHLKVLKSRLEAYQDAVTHLRESEVPFEVTKKTISALTRCMPDDVKSRLCI